MSEKEKSIGFAMGLLAGVVGGIVVSILYAPKSGKETREELKAKVVEIAQKHAPEIRKAKKQAFDSLDLIRYKLEKQYIKFNEMIKAKQLAKAKELETSDCDFN